MGGQDSRGGQSPSRCAQRLRSALVSATLCAGSRLDAFGGDRLAPVPALAARRATAAACGARRRRCGRSAPPVAAARLRRWRKAVPPDPMPADSLVRQRDSVGCASSSSPIAIASPSRSSYAADRPRPCAHRRGQYARTWCLQRQRRQRRHRSSAPVERQRVPCAIAIARRTPVNAPGRDRARSRRAATSPARPRPAIGPPTAATAPRGGAAAISTLAHLAVDPQRDQHASVAVSRPAASIARFHHDGPATGRSGWAATAQIRCPAGPYVPNLPARCPPAREHVCSLLAQGRQRRIEVVDAEIQHARLSLGAKYSGAGLECDHTVHPCSPVGASLPSIRSSGTARRPTFDAETRDAWRTGRKLLGIGGLEEHAAQSVARAFFVSAMDLLLRT